MCCSTPRAWCKLNASARRDPETLRRQRRRSTQIVAELEDRLRATGLRDDVLAFLGLARKRGWLQEARP